MNRFALFGRGVEVIDELRTDATRGNRGEGPARNQGQELEVRKTTSARLAELPQQILEFVE